jgi:hypothetical protein
LPRSRPSVGLWIGLAAAISVVLLAGCRGSGGTTSTGAERTSSTRPAARGPVVVGIAALRDLADSVGHAIYWAGVRQGSSYELTVDANGNIFIRYLRPGVPAGSRQRTSLTIATYPFANAFETLRSASGRPGAAVAHTPDGGLVVTSKASPDNAYIAYPDRDYQIEIYDPRGGRALALATKGAISPVR